MASPSGDGVPTGYFDNAMKFNPTTAVVIIVLIAGCFLLAFVSVLVRRCIRHGDAFPRLSSSLQPGGYDAKPARGLEKADVDALPLVHGADLGETDDHECPVCLADFQPDETLRLLPTCKHVFHQECIDAWFDSHSTCPLCRASLVRGEAEKTPPPGAPVARISEASEDGDSDVEVHDGATHGTARRQPPLVDSAGVLQSNARISREDEQSSARGSLFRSSESFKSGTAVTDKDSRKPVAASASIRRSSSLSADLVSLRKLLTGGDATATASVTPWRTKKAHDEWVTIDLESGTATAMAEPAPSSSAKTPAPERSWSDRFSFRSLTAIASLSRSTSDISSRHAPRLPL